MNTMGVLRSGLRIGFLFSVLLMVAACKPTAVTTITVTATTTASRVVTTTPPSATTAVVTTPPKPTPTIVTTTSITTSAATSTTKAAPPTTTTTTSTSPAPSRLVYRNLTNSVLSPESKALQSSNKEVVASATGLLAYLSNLDMTGEADGVPNYEVMLMSGGVATQVTRTTTTRFPLLDQTVDVTNWGATISRSGNVVVFASNGDLLGKSQPGIEQVYLYDVSSRALRQLSNMDTSRGPQLRDKVEGPRVSADGAVVAWVEHDVRSQPFGPVDSRLRVTNASGATIITVPLTGAPFYDNGLDFALSGDGKTIIYTSFHDPVQQNKVGANQLFLLNAVSGAVTQISRLPATTERFDQPALGQDGTMMAVWTNAVGFSRTRDRSVLALVDSKGAFVRVLAEAGNHFDAGLNIFGRPRVNAGLGFVSFRAGTVAGAPQLNYRVNAASGEVLYLGASLLGFSPGITEDGRFLFVTGSGEQLTPNQIAQNRDRNDEIWSIEVQF